MELGDATAVGAALDTLRTDLQHLVKLVADHGLDAYDDPGLVGFMHEYEQVRNQLPLVDHQVVLDAERRDLARNLCHATLPRMLAATLQISAGEAAQRVRAAETLAERVSMSGQPLPPVRPHLAAAQRTGDVSSEQADIVTRALAKVDRVGFDPGQVDYGEQVLADYATRLGPKDLRRLAEQIVDRIDPDGTVPDDKLQQDRRFFHLRQATDGAYTGEFRLTPTAGLKLQSLLGPLAKPKGKTTVSEDGRRVDELDPRHHGQRMHDALEDVCDRLLRSDDSVPDAGGTPATVIVTIDLQDLANRTGYGVAADGTLIAPDEARRLVDQADVYWAVVDAKGVLLRLGRDRRIATAGQTAALIARDHGCSFPGCDTGPEWCERHHVLAWIDGGATDLDNLTLLCRYHHHNFLARGWECEINADGLPEWRPPRWVDPDRRPLINNRIRTGVAAAQHRRQ